MENHFTAERPNRADLHLRGGARHHDHGPAAELAGTQGHALGMVAGAGGDHATAELLLAELCHAVVRPPQLEGEHRLKILTLEQHRVAEPAAEVRRRVEWRFPGNVIDAGSQDSLQVVGHGGILPLSARPRRREQTP